MDQINLFFRVFILFLIVLIFSTLVFLIQSLEFETFFSTPKSFSDAVSYISRALLNYHGHFVVISLLIAFGFFYTFVDLKEFKVRNYIIGILFVPVILCAGLYYFENYKWAALLKIQLSTITLKHDTYSIKFINEIKIYYLAFLVFFVVPCAVLFNNKNWYLRSLLFLMIVLGPSLYGSQYLNKLFLTKIDLISAVEKLAKISIMKKISNIQEIILTILYLVIGIYILKLADFIHKIRKRLDIAQIKKIQH